MHEPTHLDLFSGGGGIHLAAQWAGFRTIAHSEINPFCRRLLAERFPGEPNLGDITAFESWPGLGHVSLVTGGPPCQPFSIAGRRKGEADDRNLWPAMLGVVRRYRPDWVIVENVVNAAEMVLASWIDDLEALSYSTTLFDLPSCAVGLPSVERHVWIVAASDGLRLARNSKTSVRSKASQKCDRGSLCPTTAAERNRWLLPDTGSLRSRKGIPHFVDRIKAIGNAVPPPIAFEILQAVRTLIEFPDGKPEAPMPAEQGARNERVDG